MRIEKKKISELLPAPYNPRKISKNELEKLRKSMSEFGYVEPIIWNERTGYVIGGHQRLKILKEQGVEEVESVIVDFPEEKERALNIALNKISGKWDMGKLGEILEDLKLSDFDVQLTGFDAPEIEDMFEEKVTDYFGDERERTYDIYRLNDYDETRVTGYYQIPTLKASHYVPEELMGFNYVKSVKEVPKDCGVHFFIDDYQFERIWREPYKMFERIREKKYSCVITPDFSLYLDMPMAMKIWNVYRSRLIGQMMQDEGIEVIPTLSWAEEETFKFCFEGIESGGVVAVSTVGVMKDKEAQKAWSLGMRFAIEKLSPTTILCYGSKIKFDFGSSQVKYFETRGFKK